MRNYKLAIVATTALVGSLFATGAFAQSTGTNEVEEVVITAAAGQPTIDGVITAETAPKAKASINQEFISTQASGQTIIQSLNLTPGLNFTNSDPYGSSGGNLRIRGFDGARISLTFDGIPLNDSGNYAIFTNQQVDSELIERASVNIGTTDVDSPTASAVGGTINYQTRRPGTEFGGRVVGSLGEFNYGRIFALIDSGEIGPWGTAAFVSGSYQKYDKFKGPGDLEKWQVNGRLYQPLGDNGDFMSLAFHYNENRNNFYRNLTKAQIAFYGTDYDNLDVCTRDLPTTGVADNDNSSAAGAGSFMVANDNPANPSSCTNFYGVRINPSNTGNIRGQSKFSLGDSLTLTVDPSFQYVLANGGGTATLTERTNSAVTSSTRPDRRITGSNAGLAAFDLNGDGDTLDTVRFYTPNTTNTRRYGVTTSLIWDINDSQTVRVAYTGDFADHRQTGDWGMINDRGFPQDPFGGKDGNGKRVEGFDGSSIRGRDRESKAILNQLALEYRGQFFDDNLFVTVGLRAPFFKRDLDQHCYTENNGFNVLCTTQPVAQTNADGTVQFNVINALNVPQLHPQRYVAPFEASVEYDKLLPNLGVSYQFLEGHTVYGSYAEGLSSPRTDNLYTVGNSATGDLILSDVEPETSKAYDLGYRFRSSAIIFSASLWYNEFQNRIVSAFDPDLGFNVDRNVGDVKLWGWDGQAGWTPSEQFSLYASASYTDSELQDDLQLSAITFLPTKGKKLVETPDYTFALRAQWSPTDYLSFGLQGKHVGDRYVSDVNDDEVSGYEVFDFDARYDLPWFNDKGAYLQLNVTNLFDEDYLGNISTVNNAKAIGDVNPDPLVTTPRAASNPATFSISAPRTIQVTFSARF